MTTCQSAYCQERPLLDNHLAFLSAHRGKVTEQDGIINVESTIPGVACSIVLSEHARLPEACDSARLVPWSGDAWPDRLRRRGLMHAGDLSYMELDGELQSDIQSCSIDIAIVSREEEADEFSTVQTAGFLTEEEIVSGPWPGVFARMARKNFARPDQTFYIGRLEGQPAAVTLVVRSPGISGIYAVTTRPEQRKQGLSTALLRHAVRAARQSSASRVILQAFKNSYAEGFYQRLGFVTRFNSQLWQLRSK